MWACIAEGSNIPLYFLHYCLCVCICINPSIASLQTSVWRGNTTKAGTTDSWLYIIVFWWHCCNFHIIFVLVKWNRWRQIYMYIYILQRLIHVFALPAVARVSSFILHNHVHYFHVFLATLRYGAGALRAVAENVGSEVVWANHWAGNVPQRFTFIYSGYSRNASFFSNALRWAIVFTHASDILWKVYEAWKKASIVLPKESGRTTRTSTWNCWESKSLGMLVLVYNTGSCATRNRMKRRRVLNIQLYFVSEMKQNMKKKLLLNRSLHINICEKPNRGISLHRLRRWCALHESALLISHVDCWSRTCAGTACLYIFKIPNNNKIHRSAKGRNVLLHVKRTNYDETTRVKQQSDECMAATTRRTMFLNASYL